MRNIAFPYPTLFPYISKESKWESLINFEDARDFKNGSGNWDYDSKLEISCKLSWDIENIYSEANLLPIIDSSKIAFILSSGQSEQTGKREIIAEYKISEVKNKKDAFIIEIPSKLQSSKLKIRLIIYTDEVEINNFRIKTGSILYMEDAILQLEGDLANFSIRRTDFSKNKFSNALWFIDFKADNLNETFTTTTTLYLNNQNQTFENQLQNDTFLQDLIKADVISTVLSSILISEEDFQFDLNTEYPDDSLGKIASDWLNSLNVKKDSDLKNIRNQIINEQGYFRSCCQNIATTRREQ